MHGLISINGNRVQKGMVFNLEKLTCFLSNKVFAVSKSLKKFAIDNNYCKKDKISVIENETINGIDFNNQFNRLNIKLNSNINKLRINKFVIGFVGRMLKDKGIEDYFYVLSKCKTNKLPIIGFLVGPNECEEELFKLIKKYNFDN